MSRFTNAGKTNAMLHVEKGAVDLTDSILGGGTGKTVVLADPGTKVSIRGNMFHKGMNGEWALDATRADVIFAQNMLDPQGRIRLQDARTAVVTGNRFGRPEKEAIVGVPESLSRTNLQIQVSANVFAPAPKAQTGPGNRQR